MALASAAQAGKLADGLPAGALATVQMQQADGLIGRIFKLSAGIIREISGEEISRQDLVPFQKMLSQSIGKESVIGLFSVGKEGNAFGAEVLGVTKVDADTLEMLGEDLPRATARVGQYGFGRSGGVYAGQHGDLLYFSTNKRLLMNYLGRLSGKAAPRLGQSATYQTPMRAAGAQELSLYLNFSGTAKVLRSQLATIGTPRLFAPAVDALDTLGQYATGMTTTAAGAEHVTAQMVNAEAKDQPLHRILTHSTEFHVQDIIPADAESVSAYACAPESGAYLGRWLTRVDLFEPLGFLSDSQLADHWERSARYLGDECATVQLAGGFMSGISNSQDALGSIKTAVNYHRVSDLAAAQAHMPAYAESVNRAIAGARTSLRDLLSDGDLGLSVSGNRMTKLPAKAADSVPLDGADVQEGLNQLEKAMGDLKFVYAFRGDYLITANSEAALAKALNEQAPVLGQDAEFQAAQLPLRGAGWTFQRNLPELSGQQLLKLAGEQDKKPSVAKDPNAKAVFEVLADLINRFDGSISQKQVTGSLLLTKTRVKYRW